VHVKAAVVLLSAVVFGAVGMAWALDCEGRLVSVGQAPWEVHAICGEPTQIEETLEIILKPLHDRSGRVVDHLPVAVPKSVWPYNFGPTRLIYLLIFLEGKLVKIETGGYGR
jgi:hypothetical protein